MPLPDANDFRVTLGDEEKDRIKRQTAASVETSLTVASRELWRRIYEAMAHMAERLSAYKATDQQASRIARQMSAYMAGYQLSAVASSPLPTTASVKPRFFRNCRMSGWMHSADFF